MIEFCVNHQKFSQGKETCEIYAVKNIILANIYLKINNYKIYSFKDKKFLKKI